MVRKITIDDINKNPENVKGYRKDNEYLIIDMKDGDWGYFTCPHCGGIRHLINAKKAGVYALCHECGKPSATLTWILPSNNEKNKK